MAKINKSLKNSIPETIIQGPSGTKRVSKYMKEFKDKNLKSDWIVENVSPIDRMYAIQYNDKDNYNLLDALSEIYENAARRYASEKLLKKFNKNNYTDYEKYFLAKGPLAKEYNRKVIEYESDVANSRYWEDIKKGDYKQVAKNLSANAKNIPELFRMTDDPYEQYWNPSQLLLAEPAKALGEIPNDLYNGDNKDAFKNTVSVGLSVIPIGGKASNYVTNEFLDTGNRIINKGISKGIKYGIDIGIENIDNQYIEPDYQKLNLEKMKNKALKTIKKYKSGGNTIITHDPNDPRLKMYQDSLRLYNTSKFNSFTEKQFNPLKFEKFISYDDLPKINTQLENFELGDVAIDKTSKFKISNTGKVTTDIESVPMNTEEERENYYNNQYLNKEEIYKKINPNNKPLGFNKYTEVFSDGRVYNQYSFQYKKPNQEVIYQKFKPEKQSLINLDKIDTPYLQTNQYNLDNLKPREVLKNNNQNFKLVFPEKRTMQNAGNPTKVLSFSSEEDMKNIMNFIKEKTGVYPVEQSYKQDGSEGSARFVTDFDIVSKKMNEFQSGGKIEKDSAYESFRITLPSNLREEDPHYDNYRLWESNGKPKNFNIARALGMYNLEKDGKYHAPSVDSKTNIFLKHKNHPTVIKEINWYYSEDPKAMEFRNNYKLDMSEDYYKYVPKNNEIKQFNNGGKIDPDTTVLIRDNGYKTVYSGDNRPFISDFKYTASDLEYLNSQPEKYCPNGQCLEQAYKAYDLMVGNKQGFPDSSQLKSSLLVDGKPLMSLTPEMYKQSSPEKQKMYDNIPYMNTKNNDFSSSSWDVHGIYLANGGKSLFTSSFEEDKFIKLSDKERNNLFSQIPVGAIIGFTDKEGGKDGYNLKQGLPYSRHSAVVVGHTENGEPVIYDYGKYTILSKYQFQNYVINNITAPKQLQDKTISNLKAEGIFDNTPKKLNVNYNSILDKVDKKEFGEFYKGLQSYKHHLMDDLNLTNDQYDKLAKNLMAISVQETSGGKNIEHNMQSILGTTFGETQGLTQLNIKNLLDDPQLAPIAKKYGITKESDLFDNEKAAIASMIYATRNANASKANYNKGLKPSVRTFTYNNRSDAYNSSGFLVPETNTRVKISTLTGKRNLEDIQKDLDKQAPGVYTAKMKDKEIVIEKKTKGNTKLTDEEKFFYNWQSPNTLRTGDAENKSNYVKQIQEVLKQFK